MGTSKHPRVAKCNGMRDGMWGAVPKPQCISSSFIPKEQSLSSSKAKAGLSFQVSPGDLGRSDSHWMNVSREWHAGEGMPENSLVIGQAAKVSSVDSGRDSGQLAASLPSSVLRTLEDVFP